MYSILVRQSLTLDQISSVWHWLRTTLGLAIGLFASLLAMPFSFSRDGEEDETLEHVGEAVCW